METFSLTQKKFFPFVNREKSCPENCSSFSVRCPSLPLTCDLWFVCTWVAWTQVNEKNGDSTDENNVRFKWYFDNDNDGGGCRTSAAEVGRRRRRYRCIFNEFRRKRVEESTFEFYSKTKCTEQILKMCVCCVRWDRFLPSLTIWSWTQIFLNPKNKKWKCIYAFQDHLDLICKDDWFLQIYVFIASWSWISKLLLSCQRRKRTSTQLSSSSSLMTINNRMNGFSPSLFPWWGEVKCINSHISCKCWWTCKSRREGRERMNSSWSRHLNSFECHLKKVLLLLLFLFWTFLFKIGWSSPPWLCSSAALLVPSL